MYWHTSLCLLYSDIILFFFSCYLVEIENAHLTTVYLKSIQFHKHDLRQFFSDVLLKYIFLRYSSDVVAILLISICCPILWGYVYVRGMKFRFSDVFADSTWKDAELSFSTESANYYVLPVLTDTYRGQSLDIASYT